MGEKTRHYRALMRKNWLIWKRTLGASLCELFCPVVLMAVMAIARIVVTKTYMPEQSNITEASFFYPVTHYNNSVNTTT
jgi:ATP-binding cassette subfamily A (ABC1) protein 3